MYSNTSFWSNSFLFVISRGSLYPNIGRVYPSQGYESAALADLCHQLYGISRVVLVTTADIYGEDAVAVWNWRVKNYKFHTVGTISLVPGGLSTDDTQKALQRAIEEIAGKTGTDDTHNHLYFSLFPFQYHHPTHPPQIPFHPPSPSPRSGGWKNMGTVIR